MPGTPQPPRSQDAPQTAAEIRGAEAATILLSYSEYHNLPVGSQSYELVRGALRTLPPVTCRHQLYHSRLFRALSNHVAGHQLGQALSAPVEVLLERGPDTSLRPDALFISNQRQAIFDPKGPVKGAPDLIFDILTHGAIADKELRQEIFRLAGVREYWQISPHPQRITVNLLSNLEFKASVYELDEIASSTILPGFTVSLTELYAPAW